MLEIDHCLIVDQFRSGLCDEKAAAASMLGKLADIIGAPFAPYVDNCMKALEELETYMHSDVRESALVAMGSMLKTCYLAVGSPPWTPGVQKHIGPAAVCAAEYI